MKLLTRKAKWLLLLTCILYTAMSVMNAVFAYLGGKILEQIELRNLAVLVHLCLVRLGLEVFSYLLTGTALGVRLAYLANGKLGVKDSIVHNIINRPFSVYRRENNAFYLNLLGTDVELYEDGFTNNIPFVVSTAASI